MSWIILNTAICFPKQINFYIWKTKNLYWQSWSSCTYLCSRNQTTKALQAKFSSGHPTSAEYRCAGGRGSPSLSLPPSTRSAKDLLWNILKLIHLALRQAEMYSHKHIPGSSSFWERVQGRQCLPVFSPTRENYTGTAEMDTILAMSSAPSSLHGHSRILVYCTWTCESSMHWRTYTGEGEDPFHHRKVVDFAFPELGKCCW